MGLRRLLDVNVFNDLAFFFGTIASKGGQLPSSQTRFVFREPGPSFWDMTRQDKTRPDKTTHDKEKQDKTRQDKTKTNIT